MHCCYWSLIHRDDNIREGTLYYVYTQNTLLICLMEDELVVYFFAHTERWYSGPENDDSRGLDSPAWVSVSRARLSAYTINTRLACVYI